MTPRRRTFPIACALAALLGLGLAMTASTVAGSLREERAKAHATAIEERGKVGGD